MAKCPSHDDRKASLSIAEGDDGQTLFKCQAGCGTENIAEAVRLTMKDLFPEDKKPIRKTIVNEYPYHDPDGHLLVTKVRYSDKSFGWRYWDRKGWVYNRKGVPHVLYRLPSVSKEDYIFVVEGEKDADTLCDKGFIATTGENGAGPGKWLPEYTAQLKGKHCLIIGDHDVVGQAYAVETANALHGVAASVKLLDLAKVWYEIPQHGDVSDFIKAKGEDDALSQLADLMHDTPEWEPRKEPEQSNENSKHCFDVISAPDLQNAVLPPVKFLVEGLLPEGTGMIAAPSKIGKSWLVLDMGLSIAAGEPFMGHPTNRHGVLYLALEDSKGRLQSRMNKVLSSKAAPREFYFTTEAPVLGDGLVEAIADHVRQHPETKLIIIDTLQKIRGQALAREGPYAQDYREMGSVKAFMDKMGLSVFFVHHTRKMRDDDDPFLMISGTNGIMGAADTIMVLMKQKREDVDATLHITGRDIPQTSTVVRFNKECWKWDAIGDVDWLQEQQARQEYESSPIVKTVKKLIAESSDKQWDGTAQELMDAGRFISRTYLANSARELSSKLKSLDKYLFDNDTIIHDRSKNGSGGGRHRFYYINDEKSVDTVATVDANWFNGDQTNGINGTNDVNDTLRQLYEVTGSEELPFPNM